MAKMPDNIQNIHDNLSGFQKTYCEYRAKGLSQALAAEKAGSQADGRVALQSVGFQVEQIPGVKEYVSYLRVERAQVLPIDDTEIIGKLRKVYEECIEAKNYREANKALELLGTIIGLFGVGKSGPKPKAVQDAAEATNPFVSDEEELSKRVARLQVLSKGMDGSI